MAEEMNDWDRARILLVDIMENEFSVKTFKKYIEDTLPGDYAYQLANVFRTLYDKQEQTHKILMDLLDKTEDVKFQFNLDYAVDGNGNIRDCNGKHYQTFEAIQSMAKVSTAMTNVCLTLNNIRKGR